MKQNSLDYLDEAASVARDVTDSRLQPVEKCGLDRGGVALLVSVYLEMYDSWQRGKPGQALSPERIRRAAMACVKMREQIWQQPRQSWGVEQQRLSQLMTATMFLFKHMYASQY